jgi:hypothetical protein
MTTSKVIRKEHVCVKLRPSAFWSQRLPNCPTSTCEIDVPHYAGAGPESQTWFYFLPCMIAPRTYEQNGGHCTDCTSDRSTASTECLLPWLLCPLQATARPHRAHVQRTTTAPHNWHRALESFCPSSAPKFPEHNLQPCWKGLRRPSRMWRVLLSERIILSAERLGTRQKDVHRPTCLIARQQLTVKHLQLAS